ncbi:hypothetical protein A6770_22170 [Nostoc minutum NIES-26]|uniref:Uncharacterized protein n=1 Tax=Nostoc minutum NIES-26 TaxID=1844469 RepID=A0A367R0I3_9NOSO|nr:hypothetical protein A6770_22170 [Nostoc minutum NIES-26]
MQRPTPQIGFSGLITIQNFQGTTLMSQNHGNGNKLNQAGFNAAVYAYSDTASITDNHIVCDSEFSFDIRVRYNSDVGQGIFTDNVTNKQYYVNPNSIIYDPNIIIFP